MRRVIGVVGLFLLSGCGAAAGGDGGVDGALCLDAPRMAKNEGEPCGCASECRSGFCTEGVCCNQECAGGCTSCAVAGKTGTCTPIPAGMAPVLANACRKQVAGTCGLDGTCDGAGACRKAPAGTVCQPGSCSGDAVTGISVCDGQGACRPGADVVCVPYACNPETSRCFDVCGGSEQCSGMRQCASGSCGAKLNGASCSQNGDCASGFCADGVCCASACKAACVSCNQAGMAGRCLPVPDDSSDPHGVCKPGLEPCGETGLCRAGLCQKAAAGVACAASYCSGNVLVQASVCDGAGNCQAGAMRLCPPFRCASAAGGASCLEACSSDLDCVAPVSCIGGSCGPKQNGGICSTDSQCKSGICADGVCCDARCDGTCRSCTVAGKVGSCTPVAAGNPDPRGVCVDRHPDSCGTNGRCDGHGECQRYPAGTTCAPESCASASYTPVSSCDGGGNCLKPKAVPCYPFQCNGARCYESCPDNAACVSPNLCTGGSCGLKGNGAGCSSRDECSSGICAQGICCAQSCAGSCRSCALPAYLGACHAVLDGAPDPAGQCFDEGATSCGTDGLCLDGACASYPAGTQCAEPACSATMATSAAVCDGAGACGPAAQRSCAPFQCASTTCRTACSADTDCVAPAVCLEGSCGLKPDGMACTRAAECQSALCVDGVCCNSACEGACRSCNLSGHAGTCTMVYLAQPDPRKICTAAAEATCGNDGTCNGQGGCHLYGSGTPCAGASCSGSTLTNASMCNGTGQCVAGSQHSCAPYICESASVCGSTCSANADCAAERVCVAGTCRVPLSLAQSCQRDDQCASGHCIDRVCCASASCGACRTCNGTSPGTCSNLGAGVSDARCGKNPPCGNTGLCDGAGACAQAPTSVVCGSPACTQATLTDYHCSGSGSCEGRPSSCGAYACNANGSACLVTCSDASGCVPPNSCNGGACTLRAGGAACSAAEQCASGFCFDSVCCDEGDCAPYRCGALGACLSACSSDGDCTSGNLCVTGVCTPT